MHLSTGSNRSLPFGTQSHNSCQMIETSAATKPSPLVRSLVAELKHEAETTRRVLERVPEDRLSWSPHPKSMTLGQLALHIARVPRGIAMLLRDLETHFPTVPLDEATSVAQLLEVLDSSILAAAAALEGWGEEGLKAEWSLMNEEGPMMTLPRLHVVRSLMLNHVYHHRGQLTVYLRMLDVPLPSVYGPTADESPFS